MNFSIRWIHRMFSHAQKGGKEVLAIVLGKEKNGLTILKIQGRELYARFEKGTVPRLKKGEKILIEITSFAPLQARFLKKLPASQGQDDEHKDWEV